MENEFQDIDSQLTILQHGMDVYKNFQSLINYLKQDDLPYPIQTPEWIIKHKEILLNKCLPHLDSIKNYLIYHDCGKPYCLQIDSNGKRHFPNHSEVSKQYFLKYSTDTFIAELISKDMLCHITKPKDFEQLLYEPHIEILLLSACAAIHSNAQMFGGTDSNSFKIKLKNLDKLGCRILNTKYTNLTK